jgi:endonuclease/exonuclease/phosphatase (EEP) superfamily protein YafD
VARTAVRRPRGGTAASLALSVLPLAAATLLGWSAIGAPASGPIALGVLFGAHLALLSVLLVPVGVKLRSRVLLGSLAVLAIVAAVRLGPEWVSMPASGAEPNLIVMTWNVEKEAHAADEIVAVLVATDATLVGLLELTPEQENRIEGDPRVTERFPYRLLYGAEDYRGLALLSIHPLEGGIRFDGPPRLAADLRLPRETVHVVLAHPLPPRISTLGGARVPVGFDADRRDADLRRLRDQADVAMARGLEVVLFGDFNVSPLEHGFGALTRGLRDAHAEVGQGPGWTWRPSPLEWLPIGLLRIDLVLSSPGLVPLATGVQCGRTGDHCRLMAELGTATPLRSLVDPWPQAGDVP